MFRSIGFGPLTLIGQTSFVLFRGKGGRCGIATRLVNSLKAELLLQSGQIVWLTVIVAISNEPQVAATFAFETTDASCDEIAH